MNNHKDRSPLDFLIFGILLYLISMGFGRDASADFIGDPPNSDQDTSIVLSVAAPKTRISLESYSLNPETATHWKLPGPLEEISGLAMTGDNRLLAHNDERAIVFEIDYQNGSIQKAFQLADLNYPVAGDFEGIAATDDKIFMVTSSGRLYEFREGTSGESVLFNVYTTGVGRDCEIEGLTYDRSQRGLLLMCKDSRSLEMEGQLAIYQWSIDKKQLNGDVRLVIPVAEFSRHISGRKISSVGNRTASGVGELLRNSCPAGGHCGNYAGRARRCRQEVSGAVASSG